MGAAHLPAADVDRGDDNFVRRQPVQQQAYSGDVGDGIHSAYLVKVDLLHGNAVNMAFRLGDFLVDGQNVQLHHGGNGQTVDNAPNIPHAPVVVGVIGTFLLSVNGDSHVGAENPAFFTFFCRKTNAGDAQRI